jgi:hypothetical protein
MWRAADIFFGIVDPYDIEAGRGRAGMRLHLLMQQIESDGNSLKIYRGLQHGVQGMDGFHRLLASALEDAVHAGHALVCLVASDTEARRGLVPKLVEATNELSRGGVRQFILSGYAPLKLSEWGGVVRGRLCVEFPAEWFFGFECLIMPAEIAVELTEYIHRSWSEVFERGEPLGLIINRFCRARKILFATRRSVVQHVGSRVLAGEGRHRSATFALPWPGVEESTQHANYREAAEMQVGSFQPLCVDETARGIVICAGGMKYFTCAWVCVKTLRALGCPLQVELWHLGREEMTDEMRALADRLGVKCVDAHEVRKEHPVRRLGGWELKCYAILHSRFREVLLLDADNVPVVNPNFLFDTTEYRKTGAIFWPDIGSLGPERDIWKIVGVPYNPAPDFESGQIVVDKKRCWKALQLAMHFNEHSDFYYQHVYGDKDTFRFAFLKTGTPFSMPSRRIEYIDGTLCQHDFTGRRIFQHRIKKWSLSGRNKPTKGFLYEEECLGFLDELRQLWRTGVPSVQGPRQMLIPRILHRLWLRPKPPGARQRRWAASWRKLHPEWEEKMWTLENLRAGVGCRGGRAGSAPVDPWFRLCDLPPGAT